jgi:signal transduction histidine kinase
MQTRVKKLNGTISVDSYKGRGTTTIIDIPVPPEQTA